MQVWREFLGKKITPNKFLQLSAQPESMLKKTIFSTDGGTSNSQFHRSSDTSFLHVLTFT